MGIEELKYIAGIGALASVAAGGPKKSQPDNFATAELPDFYLDDLSNSAIEILKVDSLPAGLRTILFSKDGINLDDPKLDPFTRNDLEIVLRTMLETVTNKKIAENDPKVLKQALLDYQPGIPFLKSFSAGKIHPNTLLVLAHAYQEKIHPDKTTKSEQAEKKQIVGAEFDKKLEEQTLVILEEGVGIKEKADREKVLTNIKGNYNSTTPGIKGQNLDPFAENDLLLFYYEIFGITNSTPEKLAEAVDAFRDKMIRQGKISDKEAGEKGTFNKAIQYLAIKEYLAIEETLDALIDQSAQNIPDAEEQMDELLSGKVKYVFVFDKESNEVKAYRLIDGKMEAVEDSASCAPYTILKGQFAGDSDEFKASDLTEKLSKAYLGLSGEKAKSLLLTYQYAVMAAEGKFNISLATKVLTNRELFNILVEQLKLKLVDPDADPTALLSLSTSQNIMSQLLEAAKTAYGFDTTEELFQGLHLAMAVDKQGVSLSAVSAAAAKLRLIKEKLGLGKLIDNNEYTADFFTAVMLAEAMDEKALKNLPEIEKGSSIIVLDSKLFERTIISQQVSTQKWIRQLASDPQALLDNVQSNPDKYSGNSAAIEAKACIAIAAKEKGGTADRIDIILGLIDAAVLDDLSKAKKAELVQAYYVEIINAVANQEWNDKLLAKVKELLKNIAGLNELLDLSEKDKEAKPLDIKELRKSLILAALESQAEKGRTYKKDEKGLRDDAAKLVTLLDEEITETIIITEEEEEAKKTEKDKETKEKDDKELKIPQPKIDKIVNNALEKESFLKILKEMGGAKGFAYLFEYLKSRDAQNTIRRLGLDNEVLSLIVSYGEYLGAIEWLSIPQVAQRFKNYGTDIDNMITQYFIQQELDDQNLSTAEEICLAVEEVRARNDLSIEVKRKIIFELYQKLINNLAMKQRLSAEKTVEVLEGIEEETILEAGEKKDLQYITIATGLETQEEDERTKYLNQLAAAIDPERSKKLSELLPKVIALNEITKLTKKALKEGKTNEEIKTAAMEKAKAYPEATLEEEEINKRIDDARKKDDFLKELKNKIAEKGFPGLMEYLRTDEAQDKIDELDLDIEILNIVSVYGNAEGTLAWLDQPRVAIRLKTMRVNLKTLRVKYGLLKEIENEKLDSAKKIEKKISDVRARTNISQEVKREILTSLYLQLARHYAALGKLTPEKATEIFGQYKQEKLFDSDDRKEFAYDLLKSSLDVLDKEKRSAFLNALKGIVTEKEYKKLNKYIEILKITDLLEKEYAKFRSGEITEAKYQKYLSEQKEKLESLKKEAGLKDEEFSLEITLARIELNWNIDRGRVEDALKSSEATQKDASIIEAKVLKANQVLSLINSCSVEGFLDLAEYLYKENEALFDEQTKAEISTTLNKAQKRKVKVDWGINEQGENMPIYPLRAAASSVLSRHNETAQTDTIFNVLTEVLSGKVVYKKGKALVVSWANNHFLLDINKGFGLAFSMVIHTLRWAGVDVEELLNENDGAAKALKKYKEIVGLKDKSDEDALALLLGESYRGEIEIWIKLIRNNNLSINIKDYQATNRFERKEITVANSKLVVFELVRETNANENMALGVVEELLYDTNEIKDAPKWTDNNRLDEYLSLQARCINQRLIMRLLVIAAPELENAPRIDTDKAARDAAMEKTGLTQDERMAMVVQPLTLYWKMIDEKTYWMICRGEKVLQIGVQHGINAEILYEEPSFNKDDDKSVRYLRELMNDSRYEKLPLFDALLGAYSDHAEELSGGSGDPAEQISGQAAIEAQKGIIEVTLPESEKTKAVLYAFKLWEELKDKSPEEKSEYLQTMHGEPEWKKRAALYAIYGTNLGRSGMPSAQTVHNELVAETHKLSPKEIDRLPKDFIVPAEAKAILASHPKAYSLLPEDFFSFPNALPLGDASILMLEKEYAKNQQPGYQIPTEKIEARRTLQETANTFPEVNWKKEPIACVNLGLLALGKRYNSDVNFSLVSDEAKISTVLTADTILNGIIPAFGTPEYTIIQPLTNPDHLAALARLLKPAHIKEKNQNQEYMEDIDLSGKLLLNEKQKGLIRKVLKQRAVLSDADIVAIKELISYLDKISGASAAQKKLITAAVEALGYLIETEDNGFVRLMNRKEFLLAQTERVSPEEKIKKKEQLTIFAEALEKGAFIVNGEKITSVDSKLLKEFIYYGKDIKLEIAEGYDTEKYRQIFLDSMGIIRVVASNLQSRVSGTNEFKPGASADSFGGFISQNVWMPVMQGTLMAGEVLQEYSSGQMVHMGVWPAIKWLVYSGGTEGTGIKDTIAAGEEIVNETFADLDKLDPEAIRSRIDKIMTWLSEKTKACLASDQRVLALAYIYGIVKALDKFIKNGKLAELAAKAYTNVTDDSDGEEKKAQKWQDSDERKALDAAMAWLDYFGGELRDNYKKINNYLMDSRVDRHTYELIKEKFSKEKSPDEKSSNILDYGFGLLTRIGGFSLDTKLFGDKIKDGKALDAAILKGFESSGYLDLSILDEASSDKEGKIARAGLNRVAATLLLFMNGSQLNLGKVAAYAVGALIVPELVRGGSGLISKMFGVTFISGGIMGSLLDGTGFSPALTIDLKPTSLDELQDNITNNQLAFEVEGFLSQMFNSALEQNDGLHYGILLNGIFLPVQRMSNSEGLDLTLMNVDRPADTFEAATLVGPDTIEGAIEVLKLIDTKAKADPELNAKLTAMYKDGDGPLKIDLGSAIVRERTIRQLEALKGWVVNYGKPIHIAGILMLDNHPDFGTGNWEAKKDAQVLCTFLFDYMNVYSLLDSGSSALTLVDPHQTIKPYGYAYEEGNFKLWGKKFVEQNAPWNWGTEEPEAPPERSISENASYAGDTAIKWALLPITVRLAVAGQFAGAANNLGDGLQEFALAMAASEAGDQDEADVRMKNALELMGRGLNIFMSTFGQFAMFEINPLLLLHEVWVLWENKQYEAALLTLGPALMWSMQALMLDYVYTTESLKVIRDVGRVAIGKDPYLGRDWTPPTEYYGILGKLVIGPLQKAAHRILVVGGEWMTTHSYYPGADSEGNVLTIKEVLGRLGKKLPDHLLEKLFTWAKRSTKNTDAYQKVSKGFEELKNNLLSKKSSKSKLVRGGAKMVGALLSSGQWGFSNILLFIPNVLWGKVYPKAGEYLRYANPGYHIRAGKEIDAYWEIANNEINRLSAQMGLDPKDYQISRSEAKKNWKADKRPATPEETKKKTGAGKGAVGIPGSVMYESGNKALIEIYDKRYGMIIGDVLYKDGAYKIGELEVVKIIPELGKKIELIWANESSSEKDVLYLVIGDQVTPEELEKKLTEWTTTTPQKPVENRGSKINSLPVGEVDPSSPEHKKSLEETTNLAGRAEETWEKEMKTKSTAELRSDAAKLVKENTGKTLTDDVRVRRLAQLKEILRRTTALGLAVGEGNKYKGNIIGEPNVEFGSVKKAKENKNGTFDVEFEGGTVTKITNMHMDGGQIVGEANYRDGTKKSVTLDGIKLSAEQMLEGVALSKNCIMEIPTGEGKTFVFFAGVAIDAVKGGGIHVLTPKEGLAKTGFENLRIAYEWAGTTAGFVSSDMSESEKQYNYGATEKKGTKVRVTYVERGQVSGDFMHDLLTPDNKNKVLGKMRKGHYDEIDTLVPDLNTNFIMSAGEEGTPKAKGKAKKIFSEVAANTAKYFVLDEKGQLTLNLTEEGERFAASLADKNIEGFRTKTEIIEWMRAAMQACYQYHERVKYILWGNEIVLIGREGEMEIGRRLDQIHTMLEIKHSWQGVDIRVGSKTMLSISYIEILRAYEEGIVGATGTLGAYAKELLEIFPTAKVLYPPRRSKRITIDYEAVKKAGSIEKAIEEAMKTAPESGKLQVALELSKADNQRARECIDQHYKNKGELNYLEINPGTIFESENQRLEALVNYIDTHRDSAGLIDVRSIEEAQQLQKMLKARGIKCEIFDAITPKTTDINAFMENASKKGSVTIMTDIGGRGNDWFVELELEMEKKGMYLVIMGIKEYQTVYRQHVGRTGRSGKPGEVVSFFTRNEFGKLEVDLSTLPEIGNEGLEIDSTNYDITLGEVKKAWTQKVVNEAHGHAVNNAFDAQDKKFAKDLFGMLEELRAAESTEALREVIGRYANRKLTRMAAELGGIYSEYFRKAVAAEFGFELQSSFFKSAREMGLSDERVIELLANKAAEKSVFTGDVTRQKQKMIIQLLEEWAVFEDGRKALRTRVQTTQRINSEGTPSDMTGEYKDGVTRLNGEFERSADDVITKTTTQAQGSHEKISGRDLEKMANKVPTKSPAAPKPEDAPKPVDTPKPVESTAPAAPADMPKPAADMLFRDNGAFDSAPEYRDRLTKTLVRTGAKGIIIDPGLPKEKAAEVADLILGKADAAANKYVLIYTITNADGSREISVNYIAGDAEYSYDEKSGEHIYKGKNYASAAALFQAAAGAITIRVKGETLTVVLQQTDSRGRFACYDKGGVFTGWYDRSNKIFSRASGTNLNSFGGGDIEDLFGGKKNVAVDSETTGPEADLLGKIEDGSAIKVEPLSNDALKAAKANKKAMLGKLKSIDLPKEIKEGIRLAIESQPLELLQKGEATAESIFELLDILSAITTSPFSKNIFLEKAKNILFKLGYNNPDLIEELKWWRVEIRFRGKTPLIRNVLGRIGNLEVADVLHNLSKIGNPNIAEATREEARTWFKANFTGIKDLQLNELAIISEETENNFTEGRKKAIKELDAFVEDARKGFTGKLPEEKSLKKMAALIGWLEKNEGEWEKLGLDKATVMLYKAGLIRASILANHDRVFKLNLKERALLAAEMEKVPLEKVELLGLEKAIDIKLETLRAAIASNDLSPMDREMVQRDIMKLNGMKRQVEAAKKGEKGEIKIQEMETEISLTKEAKTELPAATIPETDEEVKARAEKNATDYIGGVKNYLESTYGIKLAKNASINGEFKFIYENDAKAIAEKYSITEEKAASLQAELKTLLDGELRLEGCRVSYDVNTGGVDIEVVGEKQLKHFASEAEAKEWLLVEVKTGRIKVLRNRDLGKKVAAVKVGAFSVAGMALTGALAEAFVAMVFEATKAIKDPNYKPNMEIVVNGSAEGLKSWGVLGIKMTVSRSFLMPAKTYISPENGAKWAGRTALVYAIVLDMLEPLNNPDPLLLPSQLVAIPTAAAGFGGFISGEWMVGKFILKDPLLATQSAKVFAEEVGIACKTGAFPSVLKSMGGALVATLAAHGIQLLINEETLSGLSFDTQKTLIDFAQWSNNRIKSYIAGDLMGGLAYWAGRAIASTEVAGPWGWIAVLTGMIGDSIMWGAYEITETSEYEKLAIAMTNYQYDQNNTKEPWHDGRALANRSTKFVIEGVVGESFVAWGVSKGDPALKKEVVYQNSLRFREVVDVYMAALLLKHRTIKSVKINGIAVDSSNLDKVSIPDPYSDEAKNVEVEYEYNVEAINAELNKNDKIKYLLGFLGYFHSEMITHLTLDSDTGTYELRDKNTAQKYFEHLASPHRSYDIYGSQELQIPLEDGKITLGQIAYKVKIEQINKLQHKQKLYILAKRILEIQQLKRAGSFTPTAQDIKEGITDKYGNFLALNKEVAVEVDDMVNGYNRQTVEKFLTKANRYIKDGLVYEGAVLISALINDPYYKDLVMTGDDTLLADALKKYSPEKLDEIISLSRRVIHLKEDITLQQQEMDRLAREINQAATEDERDELINQQLVLAKDILKTIGEMEPYLKFAGYSESELQEINVYKQNLITFRKSNGEAVDELDLSNNEQENFWENRFIEAAVKVKALKKGTAEYNKAVEALVSIINEMQSLGKTEVAYKEMREEFKEFYSGITYKNVILIYTFDLKNYKQALLNGKSYKPKLEIDKYGYNYNPEYKELLRQHEMNLLNE